MASHCTVIDISKVVPSYRPRSRAGELLIHHPRALRCKSLWGIEVRCADNNRMDGTEELHPWNLVPLDGESVCDLRDCLQYLIYLVCETNCIWVATSIQYYEYYEPDKMTYQIDERETFE